MAKYLCNRNHKQVTDMIQVHPQRAFLNTPIVVSNKGNEDVVVRDSMTGQSFTLASGESKADRYSAGEHKFVAKANSGEQEEISIMVEDALKFGGSERKGSYIFDKNPWAIIVMKDRTYFFNEITGEQFVEHNLSPDNIEEINEDYLLLESKEERSFYSLRTMSIERSFSDVRSVVYLGRNHCVLEVEDLLIIYRLYSSAGRDRVVRIKVDDFVFQYNKDRDEGIIRYYRKDTPKVIYTYYVLNSVEDGIYEKEEELKTEGEFICFSGVHSALLATHSGEDNVPSVYLQYLYSGKIIKFDSPVPYSMINYRTIWQNKEYERIKTENVEGTAVEYELLVVEKSGNVAYIVKKHSITSRKQERKLKTGETIIEYKRPSSISSILYDREGRSIVETSASLQFVNDESIAYVSYNGNVYIVDKTLVMKEGELRVTECGDPYLKRKRNDTDTFFTLDGKRIPYKETTLHSYRGNNLGLFYSGDNRFYWLKSQKTYIGKEINRFDVGPRPIIMSGGDYNVPPRFYLKNGDIIKVPAPQQEILALSSTARTALTEKGGLFVIYRYSPEQKEWAHGGDITISMYDTLHVKDAVFCSDGKSFVFQKEGALVLYDFETEKETTFPSNEGIQFNANGYRPYCTKDYYSRPVIIDPVSHVIIDHDFLANYHFCSIDKTVYCEGRIHKYFLLQDTGSRKEISPEDYRNLKAEYEYSRLDSEVIKERKRLKREAALATYRRIFGNVLLRTVAYSESFVDLYMVDINDYVVINNNGDRTEIEIGKPQYINYVSFSQDNSKVAISLKYKDASGRCLVYNLKEQKVVYDSMDINRRRKIMAVWLGVFNKEGDLAYYDSAPTTYYIKRGENTAITLQGKSFLTFSPSGKYMALSKQGYVPFANYDIEGFWGHVPSCDVFIAKTNNPEKILCQFNDHGDGICGVASLHDTVASASFSSDDKRILTVSQDGVVVVRNLQLKYNQL